MYKKKHAAEYCSIAVACILFVFFPYVHAGQNNSVKSRINYCSLFDSQKNYEGQVVESRALMTYSTVTRVDGGDSFLYSSDCNGRDYFAVANFENEKNPQKWKCFFGKIKGEKNYVFEITFTGRIQTSLLPTFGHLGWSRAEIEIIEIQSINNFISIAKNKKPNFNGNSTLIDKGKLLETINNEIVGYFVGDKDALVNIKKYLASDLRINNVTGKILNIESIETLNKKDLFGELFNNKGAEFQTTTAKQKSDYFDVSGFISFNLDNGEKVKFNYINTFKVSEDSFVLKETIIFKK